MPIQFDNTNTGVATLKPASSGTITLTLPSADGTNGQAITTNGSGQLAFSTPSGGVTGFTGAESTTTPNDTVYVDSLTASAASTDADVAFVAKGAGATLAQVPTSSTAGGNKRGTYATDWQKSRGLSTQIASGSYSTIAGGYANTASGLYSSVGGGSTNRSTSPYSFTGNGFGNSAITAVTGFNVVVGGANNTASANYAFVGGGGDIITSSNGNTASGSNSAVVGGRTNTASNTYSFVGGGYSNTANNTYSSVIGGSTNTASGSSSSIYGGSYATTRSIFGNTVTAASETPFATYTAGQSQTAILVLGRQTTDATATVLTSNTSAASTTNQVILPNNSAYYFRGEVVAGVTGAGDTKGWYIEGVIKRGAGVGTTAIVGTATVTSLYADVGASTWAVTALADTTNGGLKITVTGQASTTIQWVAQIRTTEMTY